MAEKRRRRHFDNEFKKRAIAAIGRDGNLSQVAASFGVHPTLLLRWRKTRDVRRRTATQPQVSRSVQNSLSAHIDRLITELGAMRDELAGLEETRTLVEQALRRAGM